MLLVWDNLRGHHNWELEQWCLNHGILPLFTPLSGSWLNLAESVQRILTRRALKRGSFPSLEALRERILAFIEYYNQTAKPFRWTYKGRPLVI